MHERHADVRGAGPDYSVALGMRAWQQDAATMTLEATFFMDTIPPAVGPMVHQGYWTALHGRLQEHVRAVRYGAPEA